MKVCVLTTLLSLLLVLNLAAQHNTHPVTVRGEISRDGGDLPPELTLELRNVNRGGPPERTRVYDGTFELHDLEAGQYQVTITVSGGKVVHEDFIMLREPTTWIVLRIRGEHKPLSSDDAVVSVQKLLHPVPKKAAKEFVQSRQASDVGNINKSMEHLIKALAIYPNYMEAHNNLGVCYMNLRQFDRAAAEFQQAAALDPGSYKVQMNLGLALLGIGKYEESEIAVRRAVKLSPNSVFAHYALGQVLFGQQKYTAETLASLQKSAEQFPLARLLVAHILLVRGAIPEAMDELQRYLRSGRPEKRDEVKTWLELLARSKSLQ